MAARREGLVEYPVAKTCGRLSQSAISRVVSGLCLVCQGILFRNEPTFCFLATASTVDRGWLRRGRDNNGEDNEWHWNADAAPNEWKSSTRHDDSITLMTLCCTRMDAIF